MKSINVVRSMQSSVLLAATLLFGGQALANVKILEMTSKEDLIDTSKNPGCGTKVTDVEQKTERNIRIAKFYLQSYYDLPKDSLKYRLDSYDCFDPNGTLYSGTFNPPPAVSKRRDPSQNTFAGKQFALNEALAYQKAIPDMRFEKGASRIIAWDSGFFVTYLCAGTAKSGEPIKFWELSFMLVSDEGRITHYEFWDDTKGIDPALKIVLGKSLDELTQLKTYAEAVEKQVK